MKIMSGFWKKILVTAGVASFVLLLFVLLANTVVVSTGSDYAYVEVQDVPESQAALILGARVFDDGRLSKMMQDRADSALELYETGKVGRLIMSGDHGTTTYDEVNTVKDYLLEKGVKPEDLFLDHAGFDTYDSLYRARDIFGVKSLIVVTQKFHLSRALYIGRSLGMEVYGYAADRREYQGMFWNELRESLARSKALLDVMSGAKPKFLGEMIPIEGDSSLSWD